jgi:DNA-binding PadR family transcriptional regulator
MKNSRKETDEMTGYAIDHPGGRRRARHEFLVMHGRRHRGRRGFGPPGFDRMFFGAGRKAGRGDIRATILALLAEEPMHGYQIIQEVSERTGGAWRPSPGSVYPTLQQLEDEELLRTVHSNGRRVFELTDTGREQAAALPSATPWDTAGEGDDDLAALRDLAFQLLGATRQVAVAGSAKQIAAAQEILRTARRSMYQLLAEDGDGEADGADASS